jgi:hypothetical protein
MFTLLFVECYLQCSTSSYCRLFPPVYRVYLSFDLVVALILACISFSHSFVCVSVAYSRSVGYSVSYFSITSVSLTEVRSTCRQ